MEMAERERRHRFLDVDQRTPNPVAPLPPKAGSPLRSAPAVHGVGQPEGVGWQF